MSGGQKSRMQPEIFVKGLKFNDLVTEVRALVGSRAEHNHIFTMT